MLPVLNKEVKIKKLARATKPVRLADYLHRQLKMEAASQETTASKLLEEAVVEHFGFSNSQSVVASETETNTNDHEEYRTPIQGDGKEESIS